MAPTHPHDSDAPALRAEASALTRARANLTYLIDPKTAPPTTRPSRLRTRALLRSLHYFGVVVFWRLYRWAKYALIGSVVAAVGSMAVAGSFATGVGFLVAPPGILASVVAGTAWGLGKWGWRRFYKVKGKGKVGGRGVVGTQGYEREPGLQEVPW